MERKMLRMLQQVRSSREFDRAHLQTIVHGSHESNFVLPKLIDLSSIFHSLDHSVRIFGSARSANVVACNSMIKCFVERKLRSDAFSTYNEMRRVQGISPNNFTFTFLLKACEAASESLDWSRSVHAQTIIYGFSSYVFVQNAILNIYAKCSDEIGFARKVFDDMLERDVVSWNSIIGAYILHGEIEQAMNLFKLMPEKNLISWNSIIKGLAQIGDMASAQFVFDQMPTRDNISWNTMISGYAACSDVMTARMIFNRMEDKDVYSWTSMVSAYSKIGDLESAKKLFNNMPFQSVVSWNAMIISYNENGQFNEALRMFQQMLLNQKFLPDEATLTGVISACTQLGSLDHGKWIHSYIKRNNVRLTIPLGNALIDMFAKCGELETSRLVFNQMPERCIITWTAMISGLAYNGEAREALALFQKISEEGIQPDYVIFIAVLSACTHGGLVEEGKCIFNQMIEKYDIKPRMEHFGCMADLLGRAGKFKEAVTFIQSIPNDNEVLWATLLSSCIAHGAQRWIDFIGQKIVDLEPLSSCYRVLISNSIAVDGRWESVRNVRGTMHQRGIEKVPGCSLIEVGGEVHEFLVKDTRHKQMKEVYEVLNGLRELMRHPNWLTDLKL